MVLHPLRNADEPVASILSWAENHQVTVLGLEAELSRLDCKAVAVPEDEIGERADLLVALGGDGTVLRAMRLAEGHSVPVLGVNLGKLGFLAEVDVPDLTSALTAISQSRFEVEGRAALHIAIGSDRFTAFNDIVVVRVPGQGNADVELAVEGIHFVSYAADAVIVATPTGSTAYNFSAGGPIIDPSVGGILVTPSSPHSVFNRSIMVDSSQRLSLRLLPSSGRLAVEVDGQVARYVVPGEVVNVANHANAARVVRLGGTTFYERTRRKLGITGSTELAGQDRF
jgi:NAD+ kinase